MDFLRGLDHETFVAARFYSQATGSNQRLAAALRPAIVPLTAPLEQA